ncbi:unnamed protein product [Anisakis simplex]|uniref:E3 ubiquitin-protein ligase hrd-like protein 1 (inferred by orthology to a C. elegans protein) n=1 Tax=Anisakis simplex TaxID=6269 RepID=A0A0M3K4T5_ANISI|nr:unnamed protein product [Anisakis simplex]
MPQIIFDPLGGLNSFVRQIPVPTLNSYIILSVLLTFGSISYVPDLFKDDEVSINTICSFTAIFCKVLVYLAFGDLAVHESTILRDRLCNWLLYKVLFLFGVLNSTVVEELVAWIIWFAILTVFAVLQLVAVQKLEYVSSFFFSASLPSKSLRLRILIIGVVSLCSSWILTLFNFYCFTILPFSYSLFILADLYSQIVLSIACVALSMQIRSFYKSLSTRITRHLTHQRITAHILSHYREATQDELYSLTDWCAICWEKMDSARRLPCTHYFHEWCLVGWLEQDSSCPTCRLNLQSSFNDDNLPNATIAPRTHFFHFDGTRIADWLPSFSLEFTHSGFPHHPRNERFSGSENSQLSSMAEQVREMFPQVDVNSIVNDLRISGSVSETIENILEGRLLTDSSVLELDGDDNEDEIDSQPLETNHVLSPLIDAEMDLNLVSTAAIESPAQSTWNTPSTISPCSSSEERQSFLSQRRHALIEQNRRLTFTSSILIRILELIVF